MKWQYGSNENIMLIILSLDLSNKFDLSIVTCADRNKWRFVYICIRSKHSTHHSKLLGGEALPTVYVVLQNGNCLISSVAFSLRSFFLITPHYTGLILCLVMNYTPKIFHFFCIIIFSCFCWFFYLKVFVSGERHNYHRW